MSRHPVPGFTLIELMVVLAVVAVVLLLAAPSFNDFILLQRLKSINAQVVTDVQLARSEAAARNRNVFVDFGADADSTCYMLYTAPAGTDCACDSTPVCTSDGTEVRTVRVDRSTGVQLSSNTQKFELDAATGRIVSFVSDSEITLQTFLHIDAFIDTPRALRVQISRAGRPSVCTPPSSTMPGTTC